MQQFRKILVGVDLSHGDHLADPELNPSTVEAIRRATWLAGNSGARLTFFAALDLSAHTEELVHEHSERGIKDVEEVAHGVLDGLVAKAQQDGVAHADRRLVIGQPWKEMLKAVVHENYDLVVIGTRHRESATRLLFGSTGLKLLRNCPCPVWVTKPDPDMSDVKMLVAVDLSEHSHELLSVAIGGGQLSNAKLHVLHAVEKPAGGWIFGRLTSEEIEARTKKKHDAAEQKLRDLLSQTDWRTVAQGVKQHVVDGPADAAILQAIDEHQIDLLVLGTSGDISLGGYLMGETAEQLLAQVQCSVLLIKPRGFTCPVNLS